MLKITVTLIMEVVFKPIKDYEHLYKIGTDGSVLNRFGENVKSWPNPKNGYYVVKLSMNGKKKSFRTSRLVAIHFIDNPLNKPEVNHEDGNKSNNTISNLTWATGKENIQHAINLKLITKDYCSYKISCTSLSTGNVLIFNSTREASKSLQIHATTIQKAIKNNNGITKKYLFKIL